MEAIQPHPNQPEAGARRKIKMAIIKEIEFKTEAEAKAYFEEKTRYVAPSEDALNDFSEQVDDGSDPLSMISLRGNKVIYFD